METIRVWSGDLRTKKKKRNSWDEESSFIIYLMFKASLFLIKESSFLNIVQAWFFFHQPISGVKMFIQLKDTCFIYVDVWWLYVCIQILGFFVKQICHLHLKLENTLLIVVRKSCTWLENMQCWIFYGIDPIFCLRWHVFAYAYFFTSHLLFIHGTRYSVRFNHLEVAEVAAWGLANLIQ